MNGLVKRAVFSVVGMALVLGWWTVRDKIFGSGTSSAVSSSIPAKVWEGGGTTLTIETESSDPAELRAFFESTAKNHGTPLRSMNAIEKIPAGTHSWTIDVPLTVGGNLEFQAEHPRAGSRLRRTVRSGSAVLSEENETLNGELKAREAFFLQVDANDFSRPGSSDEEE